MKTHDRETRDLGCRAVIPKHFCFTASSWKLKTFITPLTAELEYAQTSAQISQIAQLQNLNCALYLIFFACAICVCAFHIFFFWLRNLHLRF